MNKVQKILDQQNALKWSGSGDTKARFYENTYGETVLHIEQTSGMTETDATELAKWILDMLKEIIECI